MIGIISALDVSRLKVPCKNRGVTTLDNGDGTVSISGNKFDRLIDADNYLESIPRKDFGVLNRSK